MYRYVSGILALVMLYGCATAKPRADVVPTEEQMAACADEARNVKTSTTAKALIYASNVIVFPVTAALTLGFAPVWVYPTPDYQRYGPVFEQCMNRVRAGH